MDEEEQILKENIANEHNENKFYLDLSIPIRKLDLNRAITIRNNASLSEALQAFKEENISSLIIVNAEESIVGIFTEKDIAKRVAFTNADIIEDRIEKYMTTKPETLDIEDSLFIALNKFVNGSFRNLPVIVEGKVKFTLSTSDIAYFIARSTAQFVLNLPPDPHKETRDINGG